MWWYGNTLCLVLALALSLVLALVLALTDDVVAVGKSNDWLMQWYGNALCLALVLALSLALVLALVLALALALALSLALALALALTLALALALEIRATWRNFRYLIFWYFSCAFAQSKALLFLSVQHAYVRPRFSVFFRLDATWFSFCKTNHQMNLICWIVYLLLLTDSVLLVINLNFTFWKFYFLKQISNYQFYSKILFQLFHQNIACHSRWVV